MRRFVLFDLGNTLVRYYQLPDFDALLVQSIDRVAGALRAGGVPITVEDLPGRVAAENHEAPDGSVRPLEERLQRIFLVPGELWSYDLTVIACRAFMEPIFAISERYMDSLRLLRICVAGASDWVSYLIRPGDHPRCSGRRKWPAWDSPRP